MPPSWSAKISPTNTRPAIGTGSAADRSCIVASIPMFGSHHEAGA
jgi:hypothetical protein